jgi:hypothetical protein
MQVAVMLPLRCDAAALLLCKLGQHAPTSNTVMQVARHTRQEGHTINQFNVTSVAMNY